MSSPTSINSSRVRRRRLGRAWLGMAAVAGLAMAGASCGKNTQTPPPPLPDGSMQAVLTDGSVRVTPEFDECPALIAAAAPARTHVGGKVTVSARASAGQPGAHFNYHWTASAGTFTDASAAATAYTCPGADQAGPATVTITVSDGKCTISRTITVTCFANADGGVADAAIDAPATDAAGAGGAAGDGAGGAAGNGAGGAGGTGGAAGTSGGCVGDPSKCEGDLCNQCTYGAAPGAADLCSATGSGCFNCFADITDCDGLPSDLARTKCYALYTCIRDSSCVGSDQDPTPCWCGTTEVGKCQDGSLPATGPCLQQVINAAGNTDPAFINLHFIDPLIPLGRAVNLASCRATFCGKLTDSAHPSCPAW